MTIMIICSALSACLQMRRDRISVREISQCPPADWCLRSGNSQRGPQISLALSLHAPNQQKREQLMPIARRYSLPEVLDACRYYFEKTGRRMTFEYSLVGGENDSQQDAEELSRLIGGLNCHVNLIPVNPIKERSYVQSDKKVTLNFET